jgi:hypothetical protein
MVGLATFLSSEEFEQAVQAEQERLVRQFVT